MRGISPERLAGAAAALLSAGLYALAFPPFEWVALSWLALVPLFLALRRRRATGIAGLMALWAATATAFVVGWVEPTLREHFGTGPAISAGFVLLLALASAAPFFAVTFGAVALARPRLPAAATPFLWAAAWVAAEYARTQLGLRSPWGKLGDAHFGSERLRQIADLFGVYGLSGLIALANAATAEALAGVWPGIRRRSRPRLGPALAPLGVSLGMLAAALVYGSTRVMPPADPRAFEVAIVQGNVPTELRWSRSSASQVIRRYQRLTLDALRDPSRSRLPDLLVWPENAIQTDLTDPVYGPPVARVASGVPLLLGAPRRQEKPAGTDHFNSAYLLLPDGSVRHYDKRRLLPFSETRPFPWLPAFGSEGDLDAGDYSPGVSPGLFGVGQRRLGMLICFEATYPQLSVEAVRGGANVLVNLSNDGWFKGLGGVRQHLAQVVFRAVETGVPVVRATSTGVSAVIAPDGRVVDRLGEGVAGFMRVGVPAARARPTFYVRFGDWLAVACVSVCALAPALALRVRRRVAWLPVTKPEERPG